MLLSEELCYCNYVNEYDETAAVVDVGQRYNVTLLNCTYLASWYAAEIAWGRQYEYRYNGSTRPTDQTSSIPAVSCGMDNPGIN